MEQFKPVLAESNYKAHKSAAAIGLAISVGASTLLLPQQGSKAIATPLNQTKTADAAADRSSSPVRESELADSSPELPSATPSELAKQQTAQQGVNGMLSQTQTISSEFPRDRNRESAVETRPTSERQEAASATSDRSSPTFTRLLLHRVQPGETLETIAISYGISLAQLEQANHLSDPSRLQVNQFLRIPQTSQEESSFSQIDTSGELSVQAIAIPPLAESPSPTPNPTVIEIEDSSSTETAATPAITPPVERPESARPLLENLNNPNHYYVDNLRNEIASLRQKYRQSQSSRSTHSPANALSAPADSYTSPQPAPSDMSFERYTDTLEANIQKLRARQRSLASPLESEYNSTATAPARDGQQRVATAPLSSETYAPAIKPVMVSPDLPPLNAADKYLPEKPAAFNGYIWPAKGELTSGYGWRWGRMHNGIDIAAPIGTPIVAAASGVVIYAGWNEGGYGNLVEIQHPDGSISRYAHNERILVRQGQSVEQGQQIAEMGSTGFSTGPHCHFEIHRPGQGAQNPIAFLPQQ